MTLATGNVGWAVVNGVLEGQEVGRSLRQEEEQGKTRKHTRIGAALIPPLLLSPQDVCHVHILSTPNRVPAAPFDGQNS